MVVELTRWPEAKPPEAELDYEIDWSDWLDGDTIATSTWDVPEGLSQPHAPSHTDTTTKVWVGGGEAGRDYDLKNTITTAGGRTIPRTKRVRVKER